VYDVIVFGQTCYDLFDENVLANQLLYKDTKTDGKSLELICMYQQFLSWSGMVHVFTSYVHVYD